jgi:pimeloyl-ACP methyl ester carboxylesterase
MQACPLAPFRSIAEAGGRLAALRGELFEPRRRTPVTEALRVTLASRRARARRTLEPRPAHQAGTERRVRMVPQVLEIDGRRLRFALSDNALDARARSSGLWAVNLHGYFAGGGMYWRESRYLAEDLGWRVVNPSLPGFGGSDKLPWELVSMEGIAAQVAALLDHLAVERAMLLGHSMGAAVAVAFAHAYPERTLGIIYRDGAATPGWKHRSGPLVALLRPFAPDLAGMLDLVASVVLDVPDLLIGRRIASTVRGIIPDVRRNVRAIGRTVPVAALLLDMDLSDHVRELAARGDVPILPVWGCADRVANARAAEEFESLTGMEILWVLGGHSWMLGRPRTQADLLIATERGRAFLAAVHRRDRMLGGRPDARLRAVRGARRPQPHGDAPLERAPAARGARLARSNPHTQRPSVG